MEAVANDLFADELAGQRDDLGDPGHAPVERGVEAGDLWEIRVDPADRLDRLDRLREVFRRERLEGAKAHEDVGCDRRRPSKGRPTVHDPMAGCPRALPTHPREERLDRRLDAFAAEIDVLHGVREYEAVVLVQPELDARRAGVDRQDLRGSTLAGDRRTGGERAV